MSWNYHADLSFFTDFFTHSVMGSGYRTESEIKSLMEEVADFEWPSVAAVRENEDSSDSATSTRAK